MLILGYDLRPVNDEISPPAKSSSADSSAAIIGQKALKIPLPDDYVWDVFYHRPTTSSEKAELVNIGTLCVHGFFFHSCMCRRALILVSYFV